MASAVTTPDTFASDRPAAKTRSAKPALWRRVLAAIGESNRRRAEREIALVLERQSRFRRDA
jgi:hypothetical protein